MIGTGNLTRRPEPVPECVLHPARPLPWMTAARLEALAGWLEDKLAGGEPAKWLVHVAIDAARYVATAERADGAS